MLISLLCRFMLCYQNLLTPCWWFVCEWRSYRSRLNKTQVNAFWGLQLHYRPWAKGVFAASLQLRVRNEPMCVVLLQAVPRRPAASCSYRLGPGMGLPCLAVWGCPVRRPLHRNGGFLFLAAWIAVNSFPAFVGFQCWRVKCSMRGTLKIVIWISHAM